MSIQEDSVRTIVEHKGDCSKVRNCDVCPLVMKYQKEIVCAALFHIYTSSTVDIKIKQKLQEVKLRMANELLDQYDKLNFLENL